jgi:2-phosphosulfolactate phosphatase
MSLNIEVILTPAEFPALAARDLSATTCVVFDVLRATSSMLTALNNGAEEIIPVVEIAEALAVKQQKPATMLAGERHGLRITREQTGSVDFDFGNSPRDFTPEKVRGQSVAWTTTNGTRALRACAHAEMVLLGGLLNLDALKDVIEQLRPKNLLLICAGTFELPAFEDIFAAGALVDELHHELPSECLSDSAHVAGLTYSQACMSCGGFWDRVVPPCSLNARRLLANPDLAADVALCLADARMPLNAALMKDGSVRPLRGFGAKLA